MSSGHSLRNLQPKFTGSVGVLLFLTLQAQTSFTEIREVHILVSFCGHLEQSRIHEPLQSAGRKRVASKQAQRNAHDPVRGTRSRARDCSDRRRVEENRDQRSRRSRPYDHQVWTRSDPADLSPSKFVPLAPLSPSV